jgi:hypothetical protein
MNRLMVPPLPRGVAAFEHDDVPGAGTLAQFCSLNSSIYSRRFTRSYSSRGIRVSYG